MLANLVREVHRAQHEAHGLYVVGDLRSGNDSDSESDSESEQESERTSCFSSTQNSVGRVQNSIGRTQMTFIGPELEVCFPAESFDAIYPVLGHELRNWSEVSGRNETGRVVLRLRFPARYPSDPPHVRVVRPRFVFHTGHVTIGGSICAQILTKCEWSPNTSLSSLFLYLHTLLIDGGARISFGDMYHPFPFQDYTEEDSLRAYHRVAMDHGWRV
jgi:hypothetical protein